MDGFFNVYYYGKMNIFVVWLMFLFVIVIGICWVFEVDLKMCYVCGEEFDVVGMLLGVDWSDGFCIM